MKMKLILAVAAASALLLSSCRKADEVISTDAQFDEPEFTATIEGPSTKTTVNTNGSDEANRGKIEWVAGDEIKIKDAVGTEVTYVATNSGTTSTFRKASGQSVRLGSGPYTATYGTAPSTSQNYADHYKDATHAQNVYMTAKAETRSLTFKAACGLLKLTLTAATGESDPTITKIEVTGTLKEETESTTYTLNCCVKEDGTAVSISSATDFYLTLPAGTYTKMVFCNAEGIECEVTGSSAIENNKIQPVTIDNIIFASASSVLLPGKFTVNSSGKQIQFTSGNLWYGTKKLDGTAVSKGWHLESGQTAYPTSWNTSHVGHFYWSGTASVACAETYSDVSASTTDKFFCDGSDDDHKLTVDGQEGLYALTSSEWTYLLSASPSGRGTGDSYFKYNVTVNGVGCCLVIAPDGYTGTIAASYDAAAWATAEESGLVCLPAAGNRGGSALSPGDSNGYYWSASPIGNDEDGAYGLYFGGSRVGPVYGYYRKFGHSVRLVCSVK